LPAAAMSRCVWRTRDSRSVSSRWLPAK
jgi:hypothetical protein